ncbi:MAG: type VII secretion protein EssC, partial [Ruminococcus sp.]
MEQRYKLTIFSKNIYREIELMPDTERIKIGTTLSCDVRLRKDFFFDEFEIALVRNNESWRIQTTENIYLDFGGNRKIWTKPLEHGEQFCVRYSSSDAELFSGRFFVDFDYENKKYDRMIDISQLQHLVIGSEKNASIQLQSEYVYDDHVDIRREGNRLFLCNINSQYGVFMNGKRIESNTELKSYDFFSIANFSFYYKDGILYTDKESCISFHGLKFKDISDSGNALEYPLFHRNARIKVKLNDEEIPLLAPKDKPQKPKSNLILKLLPALSMIALTVVLRGMMGSTNLSFVLFSVCSMSVGAIVSVFTIINEKKEYKKEIEKRDKGYRSYIDTKRQEITDARAEEVSVLNEIYFPYEKTSSDVMKFSGDLFDRIPEDDDFLDVRIGIGNMDAIRKIEYKKQETYEADDDELVDLPVQLSEDLKQVKNAPVVVHLKEANVAGVVGDHAALYEMMKILFFDLCVRQHYHDVKVFLFVPSDEVRKYQWAKWFRHLNNDEIGCRNIICDDDSKNAILEYLYAELNRRENSKEKSFAPHFIVFVMDDYGSNYHPVSKYIEKASELGCTFLFFEEKKEYIPVGCSQLVLLNEGNTGKLLLTEDKTSIIDFVYQSIPDRDIMMMSHHLAPVYCEEISLEGTLTKNITLYQLLGILSEEDLDLNTRWSCSDVTKSMAAPLGVRSGNEIVYLDIHDGEKAHGPHGLVAGTTGSGKSELLMTYILSMATIYSPYEVAFLIIDFKGGGMGNQFKNLPHTLGVITDIDGKEINRSLISIKAELDRRKRLFAEIDVDHIDKYIRAYKKGKTNTPLPHLIIIVDEFAELKAQFGDFMAELNSAARVGRSLGVHLILATQKPQGQVDPQIDSNSKFRLCLKVQTPEDSREVIKTPLASEIKEAGRAYLMVGNNEIFELFQSAYSGAPSGIESVSNQKEFQISSVDFSGKRKVIFKKKHHKPANGEEMLSQKEAVTEWIIEYCRKNQIEKLPDICKPPLPDVIQYTKAEKISSNGILADLGLYDNPAQQKQDNYLVDLSAGHMLIIGALQTGKTNVLQLLIRDLAEKYTSDEVNFYIIDYSSMILTNFQNLPHTGGVVCPNEDE